MADARTCKVASISTPLRNPITVIFVVTEVALTVNAFARADQYA
jgi:hypothetical protein